MTEFLSRIIFPMMIFQLLSGVATGILHASGQFAIPTVADLAQNVAIIVSTLFFGPDYGITSVAVGTVVGAALSFLVKVSALKRTGFRWRIDVDFGDPGLRRIAILMVPAVLSAGATQLNTVVDRILASGLPEGRLAALNYAKKLMQLAPSIIGSSIVTVMYPTLARLAAKKEWRHFNQSLGSALAFVYFLLAPIAAGVFVLREPLVRVVYERGAFDASATRLTAGALAFLSLGIGTYSMRDLISRAFFTLQDTRTPLILGVITVGMNIALNLLFIGPLEHGGLALGTVLSATVGFFLDLMAFKRKDMGGLSWKPLFISLLRILVASFLMGAAVGALYPYTASMEEYIGGTVGVLMRLAVMAVIGACVYVMLAWVMKVPELRVTAQYAASVVRRIRTRIVHSRVS